MNNAPLLPDFARFTIFLIVLALFHIRRGVYGVRMGSSIPTRRDGSIPTNQKARESKKNGPNLIPGPNPIPGHNRIPGPNLIPTVVGR